jgi:hypothetical protein
MLSIALILPLVQTHLENVTCQISLEEQNICRRHASIVAQAVVPAGQLREVDIEVEGNCNFCYVYATNTLHYR